MRSLLSVASAGKSYGTNQNVPSRIGEGWHSEMESMDPCAHFPRGDVSGGIATRSAHADTGRWDSVQGML